MWSAAVAARRHWVLKGAHLSFADRPGTDFLTKTRCGDKKLHNLGAIKRKWPTLQTLDALTALER